MIFLAQMEFYLITNLRGEERLSLHEKYLLPLEENNAGSTKELRLGNLNAKRDWGYAPDYVEGMWKMLQVDKPDDFVLATNETYTVRDFVNESFKFFDEEIDWIGEDANEIGILKSSGKKVIRVDEKYFRPTEVDILQEIIPKQKKS